MVCKHHVLSKSDSSILLSYINEQYHQLLQIFVVLHAY